MDPSFPEKVWYFKNFNMVTELDIAGEFIYDAIHTFNQMDVITQESMLFSFLYHASVGIERLQKILLVLWTDIDNKNYREFEKSLITHSHGELSKKITESTGKKLNSRENEFLHLLGKFYKTARYQRFNIEDPHSRGQQMLADFIVKHVDLAEIQYALFTKEILITPNIKELIGKVIGVIAKEYYILLRNGCTKNNTYTYELRNGSKAEKIFLPNHRKNSLNYLKITEKIAFKELLIYLMNTKDTNSFLRFAKEIQPLDFDIALVSDYRSELSQGTISQSLIEDVEYQYEENSYSLERMEMVDLIGNTNVYFEFKDVKDCFDLIENLKDGNYSCYKSFAKQFVENFQPIEDEFSPDEYLAVIARLCSKYLSQNMSDSDFLKEIEDQYICIEDFYNFESE